MIKTILFSILLASAAAGTLLQNGDFESPPLNLTANAPFTLLTESNPIPGWAFNGTVQYLTAGPNISLPGNGHAIQLGYNGQINQTFKPDADQYILTFTLAPGGENCSTVVAVNVSVADHWSVFYLEQRYGKEPWESHAWNLGIDGSDRDPLDLVLRSQPSEVDPNITCGPVIDTLLLKALGVPIKTSGNLLTNGDFEDGPAFLSNSTEGVLLDKTQDPLFSALPGWSVTGTVKYLDSKHYAVPQGNAAIEIVSGVLSGITTTVNLSKGSYDLKFIMGDANDSCAGGFILGAQIGLGFRLPITENFTLQTNGTGISKKFSMTFKFDPFPGDSSPTVISFVSFSQMQTRDLEFCGPVIDDVVLVESSFGKKIAIWSEMQFYCMVFLVVFLL